VKVVPRRRGDLLEKPAIGGSRRDADNAEKENRNGGKAREKKTLPLPARTRGHLSSGKGTQTYRKKARSGLGLRASPKTLVSDTSSTPRNKSQSDKPRKKERDKIERKKNWEVISNKTRENKYPVSYVKNDHAGGKSVRRRRDRVRVVRGRRKCAVFEGEGKTKGTGRKERGNGKIRRRRAAGGTPEAKGSLKGRGKKASKTEREGKDRRVVECPFGDDNEAKKEEGAAQVGNLERRRISTDRG